MPRVRRWLYILLICSLLLSAVSCEALGAPSSLMPEETAATGAAMSVEGTLQLHFFDVGQGDAALIQFPDGRNALIDAGPNASADELLQYLRELGVSRIDYLIASHPHEDHIGGMDEVVNALAIGEIYMPRLASDLTPTTKAYERLLTAIQNKGLTIKRCRPLTDIIREEGTSLQVLSSDEAVHQDLNNSSAVVKLTFGNCRVLFTGDIEAEAETALLEANRDVAADLLKVGHHGSSTSTSEAFLQAVSPRFAVISCGRDNSYGHPNAQTLNRLKNAGAAVSRTDEEGTVRFTCNGTSFSRAA